MTRCPWEFAREHLERLWKQLVLPGEPDAPTSGRSRRELAFMMLCAVVAALAIKVPSLFGADLNDDDAQFYARNLSFSRCPRWRPTSPGGAVSVPPSSSSWACCSHSARSP
ncbi:hypothetical protein [Actinomadura sp. SCN-SB]|uniref:hypothetical protein n=1 Tax=Actinomadura sp. SCN-SB TaxID=3373092 RepID=UPI0037517820